MKRETMKRWLVSVIPMLAVCFVCTAFSPVSAQAKTVIVMKQEYTSMVGVVNKKAKTVKKGTTTLKTRGGFVKFTAPKTKTYTFTFSNIATVGEDPAGDSNYGYAYLKTTKNIHLSSNTVRTNGGRYYAIMLCTPYYWSHNQGGTVSKSTRIPQRFGKLKLNKGQTVYIYTIFENMPCMVNLTIK